MAAPAGVSPIEVVRLPALAGKQEHLPPLGELHQVVQGGGHALVVEVDQRVVQQEGGGAVPGQDHVADGQTHRQIELVGGPLAEQGGLVGDELARLLGGGGQLLVQQHLIILPLGQLCKDVRVRYRGGYPMGANLSQKHK